MPPKVAAATTVVLDKKGRGTGVLGGNARESAFGAPSLGVGDAQGLLTDAEVVANKLRTWLEMVTGGGEDEVDISSSTEVSDDFCTEACKSSGIYDCIQSYRSTMKKVYLPKQKEVYIFYTLPAIQFFVAGLIFMNFIVSAVQYTLMARESEEGPTNTFYCFELFFGYAFLVELVINMYGSWFWQFYKSGWNLFDLIVVVISIVALYVDNLPGIAVLRLFRAFRVIRLFKRVKELNNIFASILTSLPPIVSATGMLCLVMGIWAILGVDQFGDEHDYYFGNFPKGLLTLTQAMTMDSWSSGIARDIIYSSEEGVIPTIYFISYLFIASIIMANVLVAILLEKFVEDVKEDIEEIMEGDMVLVQYKGEETKGRVVKIRSKKRADNYEPDINEDEPENDFLLVVALPGIGEKVFDGLTAKITTADPNESIDVDRRFRYYNTDGSRTKNVSQEIPAGADAAAYGIELAAQRKRTASGADDMPVDFNPEAIERQLQANVSGGIRTAGEQGGTDGEKLDRVLKLLDTINSRVLSLERRMDGKGENSARI